MTASGSGPGDGPGAGGSQREGVGAGPFDPAFHHASELIGRRWTGAIVRALFHGKTHFRQIADAVPGLSDRLLSERLRELVAHGVVARAEHGPGYRLTAKGQDLRRILIEIARWAHRWRDEPGDAAHGAETSGSADRADDGAP